MKGLTLLCMCLCCLRPEEVANVLPQSGQVWARAPTCWERMWRWRLLGSVNTWRTHRNMPAWCKCVNIAWCKSNYLELKINCNVIFFNLQYTANWHEKHLESWHVLWCDIHQTVFLTKIWLILLIIILQYSWPHINQETTWMFVLFKKEFVTQQDILKLTANCKKIIIFN